MKNPAISKSISDIVMKAMAPDLTERYQRASDLLNDVLATRNVGRPPPNAAAGRGARLGREDAQSIQTRLRAREAPAPRFCWHCRKPLHARSDRCPFCGEAQ
jgi:hypothetical protein